MLCFKLLFRSGYSAQLHFHLVLPPWQTVYNYFRHWQRLGIWQKIHSQLRQQVRTRMDKTEDPTAGIIDSQSVKTAQKRGKFMVMTVAIKLKVASVLSSLTP